MYINFVQIIRKKNVPLQLTLQLDHPVKNKRAV